MNLKPQRVARATLFLFLVLPASMHAQVQPATSHDLEARLRADLSAGIGSTLKTGRITSRGDAEKAATEFANYVRERTGYRLPRGFVQALADAEWQARSSGRPNVPIVLFAETATRLFLAQMGGPGAQAPITRGSTPYYVITLEKLNGARLFYRRNAGQLVASEISEDTKELSPAVSRTDAMQRAYPIEAFLALYLCVSDDMGRPESTLREERFLQSTASATPSTASQRRPYGDFGYLIRRPISKLFAADVLAQILATVQ
jgi:hypothetical protein